MKNNATLTQASVNRRVFGIDPQKYNTIVRAAQLVRDERPDGIVEESVNEPWWTACGIENTYTQALDRGQVLALETPYRGTTDDAGTRSADQLFDEGPNFKGVMPDDTKHWGKLAVFWDPSNPNFIANAHIDGPAIAKVNLSSLEIDHCDVWTGNNIMQGHWSGSWQILWADPLATIPGEAICIVNKSGPWQRVLKVVPLTDVPYNGTAQAEVYLDGANTGEQITITNNWGDSSQQVTIPAGTQIRAQWYWDELKWIVSGYDLDEVGGGTVYPDVANFNVTNIGLATGDNILNLAVSTMTPQGGITLLDQQTIQCAKAGYYRFSYNIALDASGTTANIPDALTGIYDAPVEGWVDPVGSPYAGQLGFAREAFLYHMQRQGGGVVDPDDPQSIHFSAQDVTLAGSGITSIAENGIVRLHVNTPYDNIQIYSGKPSQIHCEFIRTVPAP